MMVKASVNIQSLIDQGRINKAEVLIAQTLRQVDLNQSDRAMVLSCRAQTYLSTARPERALNDLKTVEDVSPDIHALPHTQRLLADSHFALFELSQVGFIRKQDLETAYTIYDKIMRLYPSYHDIAWVHYQLGRIFLIWNRSTEATQHFERIFSTINKDSDKNLETYASERLAFIAFYDERDLFKALNFITVVSNKIKHMDPEWIIQFKLLHSRILLTLNNQKQAQTLLNEVYTIAYQNRNIGSLFADTLLNIAEELQKIPKQEKLILRYLMRFTQIAKSPNKIDVTWGRVYEMIGNACLALNLFEDAIDAFEDVLKYHPNTPWFVSINYRIAKAYYFKSNYQRTIAIINSLLSKVRDDSLSYLLYDLLGSAYFALGNYRQAQDMFSIALENTPNGTNLREKILLYYRYSTELLNEPG